MPRMSPAAAEDLVVASLAGYLATKAMEPVTQKLYERESEQDRACEDAARPGPPDRIAAQKLTRLVGLRLDEQQLDKAAPVFHYGLAISWAPVYAVLRRGRGLTPGCRSRTMSSWVRPSSFSAVLFPVVCRPETISPRRALISRRLSSVSSRPCRATSRTVDVATTTISEWC